MEKYPDSFKDNIKDQTLGTGYSSLLCQMINRCENTRRPPSTSSKRKLGDLGKIKKILNADFYGCKQLNYLPDFTSDNDASAQEAKKSELQEEFLHVKWNQQKVDLLMDETYAAQRLLIVENVDFEVVIKEFPFLTVSVYFLKHVAKLMGFDVLVRLTHSIEDKAPEVIKCIKNNQNLHNMDNLEVIEILCEYFEEEKKQFLMIFDVSTILFMFIG